MPEVRGWTNQLAWSLAGFDAAHEPAERGGQPGPDRRRGDRVDGALRLGRGAARRVRRGGRRRAVRRRSTRRSSGCGPASTPTTGSATTAAGWPGHGDRRDRRGPAVAGDGHPGRPADGRPARLHAHHALPRPARLLQRPTEHLQAARARSPTRWPSGSPSARPGAGPPRPRRSVDRRQRRAVRRAGGPPGGRRGRRARPAHPRGRDRRPDGRARRADRARADQGAGAPAGRRAQGREDADRGRHAGLRPLAAHGVPRQPGHGQDHRGAAAGAHLRPARGALQRPPGRGDPHRPDRRVHRADRAAHDGQVQPGHRRRAVHRRGVLAHPARLRQGLRPRGGLHAAQADGGPPRRGGGDRGRLPARDAALPRVQHRPGLAVPEDARLRGLRRRGAGAHLLADRPPGRLHPRAGGRPRAAVAGAVAPAGRLRQRPLRPQRLRGGGLAPGDAAGGGRPSRRPSRSAPCCASTCPTSRRRTSLRPAPGCTSSPSSWAPRRSSVRRGGGSP